MVLYYLLLSHCLSLLHSTFFYCLSAYTDGIYYLLLAHCLYIWYSTTLYLIPIYTYGTLLSSTDSLHIPLTLLSSTGSLTTPLVFFYLLLAHCLSLWYSPTFFWPTAYSTILYWLLPIHMILFYLLLAPCI